MATSSLTQDRLKELLHYDPVTGLFTRRVATGRGGANKNAGKVAGTTNHPNGYVVIRIDGRLYTSHRLAFLYTTGSWPVHDCDHKDGRRSNNAWNNLREVSRTANLQNQRFAHKNNVSGFLGVEKSAKRFQARICVNKVRHYLGMFDTPELAHSAYVKAKRQLHPAGML